MNLNDNLRDAAYIAIGMGVISAQRAQVRREEIRKAVAEQRVNLEARGAEAVKLVGDIIKQADANIEPIRNAVEPVRRAVETQLRAMVPSNN